MLNDMRNYSKKIRWGLGLFSLILLLLASCKKDKYYFDGGKSDPNFKGTMLQYLQSKPVQFDTIAQIIKIAGLEKEFQQDELTFFAPTDQSVRSALKNTNNYLYQTGKDTLKVLTDIRPQIWRKYLMMYMFKGANRMKDYYQLDINLKSVYPGQNYYSYNNVIFNIGVIFDDINGIKYAGYRHLTIGYVTDLNKPTDSWVSADISSSDIKPLNGVVHTLNTNHIFGFDYGFVYDVYAGK
ncbi:hypothetical protein EYS08_05250 [Pedobacter kyonggii]|uniref:FAS1 domain-containing protein n=2 Tax=Pedobacter kyonggii TaxID=1926871 RepID=A0A4Q9HG39_9SPHI|nr:hypothetical protein EYS08_05250 [Pedobacter kyonggii]